MKQNLLFSFYYSLHCTVLFISLFYLFCSFLFLISFLFLSFSPSALSLFLCSIPPVTERYDVSHHFMSYRVITCCIALYCTDLFTISSFSLPSLLSYCSPILSSFSLPSLLSYCYCYCCIVDCLLIISYMMQKKAELKIVEYMLAAMPENSAVKPSFLTISRPMDIRL